MLNYNVQLKTNLFLKRNLFSIVFSTIGSICLKCVPMTTNKVSCFLTEHVEEFMFSVLFNKEVEMIFFALP